MGDLATRTAWVAGILIASLLAGCTGGEEGGGADVEFEDLDESRLAAGRGAIAGLLIDDRFRPIHLTDVPETEFQTTGFVLLQETGRQVQTTANGEFAFLNIAPGRYTLRVQAGGHEAVPTHVTVVEGEFAEVDVVARRIVSNEGAVLVQEYSIFVPCAVGWVIQMVIYNCATDLSGDNSRYAFGANYTAFTEATALITEMKANKPHYYNVQVREDDGTSGGGDRFAVAELWNEDYVKMVNPKGVKNTEHDGQDRNVPWNNTVDLNMLVFPGAPFHTEINQMLGPYCNEQVDEVLATADDAVPEEAIGYAPIPRTCGRYWGAGPGFAYEARFVQSLFLGPPEVDLAAYCVICE